MNAYEQRRAAFAVEERRLARISFRLSLLRGGLFLGFAASLIAVLATASSRDVRWWIGCGGLLRRVPGDPAGP